MLHGDKGADGILETSLVVVHPGRIIHVREFQHDGSELMVIEVNRSFLGQPLEVVIGVDAGVDWGEMFSQHCQELFPRGGHIPVDGAVVVSPP